MNVVWNLIKLSSQYWCKRRFKIFVYLSDICGGMYPYPLLSQSEDYVDNAIKNTCDIQLMYMYIHYMSTQNLTMLMCNFSIIICILIYNILYYCTSYYIVDVAYIYNHKYIAVIL